MDKQKFEAYISGFLRQNSKLNLISKNDEKFLWGKHIYDSLAIENFFNKYNINDFNNKKLLDIGTGGGFPSIPISLNYPELEVTALDSIRKKISAITEIKQELEIHNLIPLCDRAENLKGQKFDYITSRAVAALKILIHYAIPLLKDNGYFIAYKSLKVNDEISEAQSALKKYNAKVIDIMEYKLPLKENHTRNLVIITKS
ncbi:MAG: 16S rRNA (guanine(527)-N(7))-methyltransferase RsmG [Candidatus Gastranaerophilaceae bacterium]|nr:16S rRNA (guanine(527)-N(7))-methyltransferase RsmG [Candidatus Gastranaerophilaceae bacterium]